jgi:hypothetical protein
VTQIPPPPEGPPPRPANPYAAPSGPPPPPGPPLPQHPEWGPYAVAPKKRGFVWWEGLAGVLGGILGNVLIIVAWNHLGKASGLVLLLYTVGWLVVPSALRHWSYTVGYVVGVFGAIALGIVVVIYSCSSTYGNGG